MGLYSTTFRVVCMLSAILMFLTGVTGNILIIWTIARVKRMRTVQNMLVAILAVVDLFISGYLLPVGMDVLVTNKEPDRHLCKFQSIITAFLFSCSIQFIMLIALSRYCKICHSQKFATLFTVRNILISIITICSIATGFASSIWFNDFLWTFEKPMHSCIFHRYGSVMFSVTMMSVALGLPSCLTAFSYIKIYRHVTKASKEVYKNWNNGLSRRKLKIEQMTTRSQFVVFIMYMIMYLPFFITAVGGERSNYPDEIHTFALHMAYLNSCINCILYGVLNKNMRQAYLEALPCLKQRQINRVGPNVTGIVPTVSGVVLTVSANTTQTV